MITKDHIGRKIIVNGKVCGETFIDSQGVIKTIYCNHIGVEFDHEHVNFHTCNGTCKRNHGFFVKATMIKFKNKITEKDIGKRVSVYSTNEKQGKVFNNDKGTIVKIVPEQVRSVGIKFDQRIGIHTCDDACERGYGYYVTEDMVTFIDEEENKPDSKNPIIIKTELVVNGLGQCCRKIVDFQLKAKRDLPENYRNSKTDPIIYAFPSMQNKQNKRIYYKEGNKKDFICVWKGDVITELEYQKFIDHCKRAAEHLKKVNSGIKKLAENWHGNETITI